MNFSSGADIAEIEVVLGKRPSAVLTGSVDFRGGPAADFGVVAFSVATTDWGLGRISRDVHVGRPDQNGQFRIERLFAADYFVAAMPARGLSHTAAADEKLLGRLRRYATKVSISDSRINTLRLRMSPVQP